MTVELLAFGLGIGTKSEGGAWLEVFYPSPVYTPEKELIEVIREHSSNRIEDNGELELGRIELEKLAGDLRKTSSKQAELAEKLKESTQPVVLTWITENRTVETVPEGYLKLHLLSHRFIRPHEIDLGGLFRILPNVAWTSEGAVAINELPGRQLQARLEGRILEVNSVDKFPKMVDYIVPESVRIADTSRVRLGAYVGEGTTIMHEGFVNFNAGTEGKSMIEGRISSGVFIGEGSDLGGGCSTMGTLSGGGNIVISVGKESLLGANSGIGIPLGDRCVVESGLYVTAGSKVILIDSNGKEAGKVKARELAGRDDLLFRRNSVNGALECLTNKTKVELNEELHVNQ